MKRTAILLICLAMTIAPATADQTQLSSDGAVIVCDAACISEAVHGPLTTTVPWKKVVARSGASSTQSASQPFPDIPGNAGSTSQVNVSSSGNLLFTLNSFDPTKQPTVTMFVPKGTIFPVHTMQSYSSFSAAPGGKVRYELLDDVIVDNHIVAMKGDTAVGTIQAGENGTQFLWFGHGANLRISVDKVYNFCGDTIEVDFDRSEFRQMRGNLLSVILPIQPDKDVHIVRGQEYAAFANRPQKVCSIPTSQADPPGDSAALKTTDH